MIDRQNDNRRIVMYIFDMVEKYPNLRFGQILSALNAIKADHMDSLVYWENEFYIEPSEILKRVEIAAEKLLKESL